MSCDLANGRLEVCKDAVGGIDAVYFINYGDYSYPADVTYVSTTDTIDAVSGVSSLYKYELKGTNSFECTPMRGLEILSVSTCICHSVPFFATFTTP